jgi:hypothetical protein
LFGYTVTHKQLTSAAMAPGWGRMKDGASNGSW